MFDFYEINIDVKIKQNLGQIGETMKNKDMSRLVSIEAAYSKDVSSRVSWIFVILTQCQKKYCWSKVWYKNYKKIKNRNTNAPEM